MCRPRWDGALPLVPQFLLSTPRSEPFFQSFLLEEKKKYIFHWTTPLSWFTDYGLLIHYVFYKNLLSYLLLQGWLSRGKGQWGTGCWSGWIFQVRIHLLTTSNMQSPSVWEVKIRKLIRYRFWLVWISSNTVFSFNDSNKGDHNCAAGNKTSALWCTAGHTPPGNTWY